MKSKIDVDKILKDIEENHNWSWIREIYERNRNNLNTVAIFYRGKKITYREFFNNSIKYAKSMKELGLKKGSEIPMCLANCPETVYLLAATNMIGAKANIFGSGFDKGYLREIIDGCDSKVLFATDDMYGDIEDVVNQTNIENKVIISLNDSLPNHKDPYEEYDKEFYDFKNHVPKFKEHDKSVLSVEEFEEIGKNYSNVVYDNTTNLEDEFTITYSSGSTNSSRPKGIVHCNRSYVTMGRFHDKDASDTRPMKNMTVLASIPTLSNTNLASNISDTLMQGCAIATEPIYDKNFFFYSLIINKPNFVVASKSFIVHAMKNIPENYTKGLPFLMALFASGEATSKGEEKFINKTLKTLKAGTAILPRPISPVPLSIAGGDCEHGGFYFNLFKKYNDLLPYYKLSKEDSGVKTFSMVDYAVLDELGNYCQPFQIGRLVANSPCSMKEYKNNAVATNSFYIKDSHNKIWGDCKVFAYYDNNKHLHIKGRFIDNKEQIPPYIISDIILKDTKNIMSCEVVPIERDNALLYVAHIELQPDKKNNEQEIVLSCEQRMVDKLGNDVAQDVFFRVRTSTESFPLTGCGKRNNNSLVEEGISDKCFKPFFNGESIIYLNYNTIKDSNNNLKLRLRN